MGVPSDDLTRDVDAATSRLLDTAASLTDDDVRAPSILPGWTRGHVLTHIARNADALVNLLGWAHGSREPMYGRGDARERDIEAGAGRPADEQLADLRASADRYTAALQTVPADAWDTVVEWRGGKLQPLHEIPWKRLVEVEVHHVDLGAGYSCEDWPDGFSAGLLDQLIQGLPQRVEGAFTVHRKGDPEPPADQPRPVVTGSAAGLAGWLSGRTSGDDLTVVPSGELPHLPAWI
ncbi:MAG: maleylpyruvate isomerase family mycothiol-dependent enzyme [Streptosporangiales bacterium]|nr:maleylpyruvate isomerase family mycothiol-dependent enzyme [Streptosporangiales bacterium]